MQTTSSAMIDDLLAVIGKHRSSFIGFYDDLNELQDASQTPSDGMQAIVLLPSEFYYHADKGKWVKFAPVGEVHPSYIGAYDTLQDLQLAKPRPSDGDVAIIGKKKFYIYASGSWDALISSSSGTESAQVTKNAADIVTLTKATSDNANLIRINRETTLKINTVVATIRALLANLDPRPIFEYYGAGMPTLPNRPQSAYFINVYALNASSEIALPYFENFDIRDGAIFFVGNGDTKSAIKITIQNGFINNNSTSLNVPPGNVAVLAKVPSGWQQLISGYIPSSSARIVADVKAALNGELHTNDEILSSVNNWLANPTTKAKLDNIMISLGYEKTATPSGPHPSTIRIHAGTGDDYPTDFSGELGTFQPHQDIVFTGLNVAPKKIWVAVPQSVAPNVAGISANEGLMARWQFSKISVNGEDWTVFISPTALADERIKIDIVWRA